MQITIEISVFPLDKNYSPFIRTFLDSLLAYPSLKIRVQPMSTLIIGDFDECMRILQVELKNFLALDQTVVAQIKIINLDLSEQ